QDRDEEDRDQDRCADQPGGVEDDDDGRADHEGPPELVDLGVAEVRKDGREDRRLKHVLGRMSGVAMLALPGVTALTGRSLVRSAAGAEHAVRYVVRAVVAPHRADSLGGR